MSITTPTTIDTSTVFGYVFEEATPIEGAVIHFLSDPFMLNDNQITIDQKATTDAAGLYSASLPETVATGTIVTVNITYTNSAGVLVEHIESIIVPVASPTSVQDARADTSAGTVVVTGGPQGATGPTGATGPAGSGGETTDALMSATTTVDVLAAAAPSSGQVLTATSSTAATWQTPTTGTVVGGGTVVDNELCRYDSTTGNLVQDSDIVVDDVGRIHQTALGDSVIIGNAAGANDDLTANENIHIGKSAGTATTTGAKNVFIGSGAGSSHTTGSYGVAIGPDAGSGWVGTSSNVAIGRLSQATGTGADNVSVGTTALNNFNLGSKNVAVGAGALKGVSGNSQSSNVGIGYEAGKNITTGVQNVFIGRNAGDLTTTGDYNVIIGCDAGSLIDAPAAGTDNHLNIGATIFADMSSNKQVGIGIAAPTASLHVDQTNASGAKPVLRLDQADVDDSFIDFIGTSAADGSKSISSDTTEDSAKFGAIRIEINGTTKWIRLYDDES